ncbi:MAG: hydroxyacylglutathione hydrolase [Gammaproteobacteria bacterium]
MQAIPVTAFSDNYIWLVPGPDMPHSVAVVDPGDAAPVLDTLTRLALLPAAILVTHHHYDHVGGIQALRSRFDIPVYGPARGAIPGCEHRVSEGDALTLGNGLSYTVLETPGHTLDHLAYYGGKALFCGDTLFAGGCGRLFEGSAQQMYRSLEKIRQLPGDTLIYCAHEYTLGNLRFASLVEPDNRALATRLADTLALRRQGQPTVPSTLALEKETNPFLRCHIPAVQQAAERFSGRSLATPEAVFTVIRYWKDSA